MVQLVLLFYAAQNRNGIFDSWFGNHNRLETTGKGRVLFYIVAILIQSCRANTVQFATRKGRLNQVCGIHCAVTFTCSHKGVHFIDEQDSLASGFGHLSQNRLQAFLKITAIFSTGNQGPHVQGQQAFTTQRFRYVPIHNAQGQTLCNCGFTHTWLTNQNWVVLCTTAKHLHSATDFLIATNNRIDLSLFCAGRQVLGVFLQRLVAIFCTCGICSSPLANIVDRAIQCLRIHLAIDQCSLCAGLNHAQRHQHTLYRYKTIARFLRDRFSLSQNLARCPVHIDLRRIPCDLRLLAQQRFNSLSHDCRLAARSSNQIGCQSLIVIHQCF